MVEWLGLMPLLVAMVAVVVAPALPWVRILVRSNVVALAAAPALTFGVVVGCTIVYHALGVPFRAGTVLPLLVVLALLGAWVWRRHVRSGARAGGLWSPAEDGPTGAGAPSSTRASGRSRLALVATVTLGWVLAALPMLIAANPVDPVQQWDSTFHMNGVWSILHTGQAQPQGGLSPLYGGRSVFYPTGWHAFTALFSTPTTVIQASNVSSLLIMGIWVVGCAGLTSVITRSRLAVVASPVIAGTLLDMPADALTMYNQWPNVLGIALLPGLAALAVVLGRRVVGASGLGARELMGQLPLVALVALGFVGAVGAHPTTAFSLVAVLMAPVLAGLWGTLWRSVHRRSPLGAIVSVVLMVVVVLGPLWLLTTSKVQAMGNYPRYGISWVMAITHAFTPSPPFSQTTFFGITVAVTGLLVLAGVVWTVMSASGAAAGAERSVGGDRWDEAVGAVGARADALGAAAVRADTLGAAAETSHSGEGDHADVVPSASTADATADPTDREDHGGVADDAADPVVARPRPVVWPIVSYLVFAFLTFIAYAPDSEFRTFLLAPWYMDARRIMSTQGATIVPLAAIGFAWCTEWVARHMHAAGAVRPPRHAPVPRPIVTTAAVVLGVFLLVITMGGAMDARLWAVNYVYDADHLGKPGMATSGELAMLRRMSTTLPADAVVLGDPIAGAAYTEVIGQRTAVFPQLSMANEDAASQRVLAYHFNEIGTNPEVCEVVRKLKITYFYQDEDGWYYQTLRSRRAPGLYNVDTSTGFELVDRGGTAKLYRITACG